MEPSGSGVQGAQHLWKGGDEKRDGRSGPRAAVAPPEAVGLQVHLVPDSVGRPRQRARSARVRRYNRQCWLHRRRLHGWTAIKSPSRLSSSRPSGFPAREGPLVSYPAGTSRRVPACPLPARARPGGRGCSALDPPPPPPCPPRPVRGRAGERARVRGGGAQRPCRLEAVPCLAASCHRDVKSRPGSRAVSRSGVAAVAVLRP